MSKVEKIKFDVTHLSKDEFVNFRNWFTERDAIIWEHQIEEDIKAGKLEQLANEAIKEFKAGRCTEL